MAVRVKMIDTINDYIPNGTMGTILDTDIRNGSSNFYKVKWDNNEVTQWYRERHEIIGVAKEKD
jgi:hypothetical protein